MNETIPFFQSRGFWLLVGIFIGAFFGFFVAALCAVSGQASRDEERWEEEADVKKDIAEIEELALSHPDRYFAKQVPITKGKSDRE